MPNPFSNSNDSFILAKFREFHAELIRLKALLTSASRPQPQGPLPPAEEGGPVRQVSQRLVSLLERQELEAGRQGGDLGVQVYKKAQYLMVVLADEIFLNFPWEGTERWKAHLLESQMFNDHRAGELFFDQLDDFLTTQDPVSYDLGRVFLLALGLGFEGKYRNNDPQGELSRYRQQLYRTLSQREPRVEQADFKLNPQSYSSTLTEGELTYLPNTRTWLYLPAAILLVYLLASHLSWLGIKRDLSAQIDRLVQRQQEYEQLRPAYTP